MMLFQFFNCEDGTRSKPVALTVEDMVAKLPELVPPDARYKVYLLCLINDVNVEDWEFSTRPLVTVASFLSMHGVHDHEREILRTAERDERSSSLFPSAEGGDSTEPL